MVIGWELSYGLVLRVPNIVSPCFINEIGPLASSKLLKRNSNVIASPDSPLEPALEVWKCASAVNLRREGGIRGETVKLRGSP